MISAKIKKWVISTLLTEMTDFPPLNSLPFHLIACERQTFLLAHRRRRTFLEEERLRLSDRNSILMTQNLPGIRSEALIGGRIVVLATGFIM